MVSVPESCRCVVVGVRGRTTSGGVTVCQEDGASMDRGRHSKGRHQLFLSNPLSCLPSLVPYLSYNCCAIILTN